MADERTERRNIPKGARNPLIIVRDGGQRLFDYDPIERVVYIKPWGRERVIVVDLKQFEEDENPGG